MSGVEELNCYVLDGGGLSISLLSHSTISFFYNARPDDIQVQNEKQSWSRTRRVWTTKIAPEQSIVRSSLSSHNICSNVDSQKISLESDSSQEACEGF